MRVRRRMVHVTADGRLLVTHRDDYDNISQCGGQREPLGDRIDYRLLSCKRWLNLARRRLDGIVCGHIHRAALIQRDGLVCANDGDGVDSLTMLTEDADGALRLLGHRGAVLA